PMGTRNEVFTGGYRPDPDFPTITWTDDESGRAIFYYEGVVNERFATVHT
ncbi:MAG: catechol 2,3-dioxygenase, partial [Acidimicrobiia bacterium]|nr:catechol 2,3-dioxygenase [Acidimicrobiia bacterium]